MFCEEEEEEEIDGFWIEIYIYIFVQREILQEREVFF